MNKEKYNELISLFNYGLNIVKCNSEFKNFKVTADLKNLTFKHNEIKYDIENINLSLFESEKVNYIECKFSVLKNGDIKL